jgi:predicted nucleic acid-binding protein
MDAFDADVLIYAATPGHPLGRRVLALFHEPPAVDELIGVGSVLLLPELLSKPMRTAAPDDVVSIAALLTRLQLLPVDRGTAELALALGARYGLRAPDAVHLATAVGAGADRFLTNNRRDFAPTMPEIDVTYPTDLPDPA